jgi:hypothetical protein
MYTLFEKQETMDIMPCVVVKSQSGKWTIPLEMLSPSSFPSVHGRAISGFF